MPRILSAFRYSTYICFHDSPWDIKALRLRLFSYTLTAISIKHADSAHCVSNQFKNHLVVFPSLPEAAVQTLPQTLSSEKPLFCSGTYYLDGDMFLYYGKGNFINNRFDILHHSDEQLKHMCQSVVVDIDHKDPFDKGVRFATSINVSASGLMQVILSSLLTECDQKKVVVAELSTLSISLPGYDSHVQLPEDVECTKMMLGSLVIVLPTNHDGTLALRHSYKEWTFDVSEALSRESNHIAYVAFRSDVEHTFASVKSGHRIAMTYNLWPTRRNIIKILAYLDLQTLLACRTLSRLFMEIIDGSIDLQYVIELAVANCVDHPGATHLPTFERLKALRHKQAAWYEKNLDGFLPRMSINLPRDAVIWDFGGGILVTAYRLYDQPDNLHFTVLDVVYVYSAGPDYQRRRHCLDKSYTQFVMDPAQDVVLLWTHVDDDENDNFFTVLSLSTCTQHSRANTVFFYNPNGTLGIEAKDVNIVGNLVFIACRGSDSMAIVDWMTCVCLNVFPTNQHYGRPLSDSCYISVIGGSVPWLQISAIERKQRDGVDTVELEPIAIYQLPLVYKDVTYTVDWPTSKTSHDYSTRLGSPKPAYLSTTSPVPVMHALRFTFEDAGACVFMYTVQFLEAVKNWKKLQREVVSIPWNTWGPSSTFWFPEDFYDDQVWSSYTWRNALCGYRLMLPNQYIDFNPLSIRRALGRMARPRLRDYESAREGEYVGIFKGTLIRAGNFEEQVVATAPWRCKGTRWVDIPWHMLDEVVVSVYSDDNWRRFLNDSCSVVQSNRKVSSVSLTVLVIDWLIEKNTSK
ncbi:hypothetical protein A0H81_08880 [Grifola frondosa]|uniref:F-box domain-containing protein n=1 Tax=Grifola frondosa TaxID=5627 RepID=A0A1C7M4J4_GRIFR|nr:hypothetical protein A0H81_08880 [Grifola frondosa]